MYLFPKSEEQSTGLGISNSIKDCRMGRSDKVSLWYVSLLINTRFRFFILEKAIVKRI